MTNILKENSFTCALCGNTPDSGKMVIDGLGKTQASSGLQRISTQIVTNNSERQYRAYKPESFQQPFWRSNANSFGQRVRKIFTVQFEGDEIDGRH